MPDTGPAHTLQGTVAGSTLRLRSPLNPRSLVRGYRALLVGAVVANPEGGSTIVATVGLSIWLQLIYALTTVAFLLALLFWAGPLVGGIFVIAAALGFIATSFASVDSARTVVTATAAIASETS